MNKFSLALALSVLLSSSAFGGDLNSVLKNIADNADVANGSTEISNFDIKTFDVNASLQDDLAQVKANFDQQEVKCGPYGVTHDRRETIKKLSEVTSDQATADALTELYQAKKILKMYSIRTNNTIECSQMWIEVFTTEGQHLELYYGMND